MKGFYKNKKNFKILSFFLNVVKININFIFLSGQFGNDYLMNLIYI